MPIERVKSKKIPESNEVTEVNELQPPPAAVAAATDVLNIKNETVIINKKKKKVQMLEPEVIPEPDAKSYTKSDTKNLPDQRDIMKDLGVLLDKLNRVEEILKPKSRKPYTRKQEYKNPWKEIKSNDTSKEKTEIKKKEINKNTLPRIESEFIISFN
jgi:hypothetical protein